jgi:hypothetical protein
MSSAKLVSDDQEFAVQSSWRTKEFCFWNQEQDKQGSYGEGDSEDPIKPSEL